MELAREDPESLTDLVCRSSDRLNQLWKIYGHKEESLEKRKKIVYKYSNELFADMIGEEERRIEEKRNELMAFRTEMKLLSTQLDLPIDEIEENSLLDEQTVLVGKIEELKKLKVKKMELWLELREKEKRICEEIGEDLSEEHTGIPTEQEVSAMKSLIETLEGEVKRRNTKFLDLKQSVLDSLALVEKVPTSGIERTLLRPVKPILSVNFLKEAEELQDELISQINKNKDDVRWLWGKIKELWKRLEIEEDFQNEFEETHTGFKPSIIEQLHTEHNRLEVLKIANLSNFISRLRNEIMSLSNNVLRNIDLPAEVTTEDCLTEHELILEQLTRYSIDNQKIIELYNKRNEMWESWKDFEAKAEDPNRLNNRGGGLLKEEKARREIGKNLPKIEKEICKLSNGFEVFGEDVMELFKRQLEEHNRGKEDKKAEKKKKIAGVFADNTVMNMTRKRAGTPSGLASAKRNKLTPYNKVVPSTPRTGRLRNLVSPANTYTDFTNHQQIFQSTLNTGVATSTSTTPKKVELTPKKVPTPRRGIALNPNKKLFMTPTMHL